MAQFGLQNAAVVAEGLGSATALLLSAWYPERVAGLGLIDAVLTPPADDSLTARALRDCPPDWPRVRLALRCPVIELTADAADLGVQVERLLLSGPLP
jgi:pimeloyl-ACP methyl ester carboxylesterase